MANKEFIGYLKAEMKQPQNWNSSYLGEWPPQKASTLRRYIDDVYWKEENKKEMLLTHFKGARNEKGEWKLESNDSDLKTMFSCLFGNRVTNEENLHFYACFFEVEIKTVLEFRRKFPAGLAMKEPEAKTNAFGMDLGNVAVIAGVYEVFYLDSITHTEIMCDAMQIDEQGNVLFKFFKRTGKARITAGYFEIWTASDDFGYGSYITGKIMGFKAGENLNYLFGLYTGLNREGNIKALHEVFVLSSKRYEEIQSRRIAIDSTDFEEFNKEYNNIGNYLLSKANEMLTVKELPNAVISY